MRKKLWPVLMAAAFFWAAGADAGTSEMRIVPKFNPARFAGRWYEIALIPSGAERGCSETTLSYTLAADGRMKILNECLQDGKQRQTHAVAWHSGPRPDGEFNIRFLWPFNDPYWIIALDRRYQWAMIGHPARRYLWILSRKRHLDFAIYNRLIHQAIALGYNPGQIRLVEQPEEQRPDKLVAKRNRWSQAAGRFPAGDHEE